MFLCHECNTSFDEANEYNLHKINTHNSKSDEETVVKNNVSKELSCMDCQKIFQYKKNLNRHLRDKTCLRCKLCKRKCDSKEQLDTHMKSHFAHIPKFQISSSEENEEEDSIVEGGISLEHSGFDNKFIEKVYVIPGHMDLYKCFQRYKSRLRKQIQKGLKRSQVKFYITMKIKMFKKGNDGRREYDAVGFYGGTYHCLTEEQVEENLDQSSQTLNNNFEKFATNGSGWILDKVEKITLMVAETNKPKGGTYIPTPQCIKNKRAIINVQNKDLRCFEYSILAALHHKELKKPHFVWSYKKWINKELDMSDFPTPFPPKMIQKFEKKNSLSINLYHIKSDGGEVTPFLISKTRHLEPINLLLIEDTQKNSYHYTYIKSLSRLLVTGNKEKGSKFCPYCLHRFSKETILTKFNEHKKNCGNYNPAKTILPKEGENIIKFKNFKYMDKRPVVIYADFESFNDPCTDEAVQNYNKSYTRKLTKQYCSGYCYTIVSPHYEGKKVFTYRGKKPIPHFLKSIHKEAKKIQNWFYKHEFKFPVLNSMEQMEFNQSEYCYLCNQEFCPTDQLDKVVSSLKEDLQTCGLELKKIPSMTRVKEKKKFIKSVLMKNDLDDEIKNDMQNQLESLLKIQKYLKGIDSSVLKGHKVADHDHIDGSFRGAAHNICNLMRRKSNKITCFFHNFTGYDSHHIVKNLNGSGYKPKVIAKGLERYIYLSTSEIEFKDSLQFLPNSLEQLTKNLRDKEGAYIEKFPNLWTYFKENWGNIHESNFELITKKLHYPYSYITSAKIFKETSPPSIESFKSDITNEEISSQDYESFLNLWNQFGLKNIGELHNLYVEVDTHLLADCFEKFRDFSLKNYKLDPAHFISAPSLSWESALLYTDIKLEIPTDPDIHMFIDRGIRGGISFVGNPHAKSSNKYINPGNDKEEDYIMFFDVNNQYGAAMSEYLPTDEFQWDTSFDNMSIEDQTKKILNLKEDDDIGYIFSCDLSYPDNLHDYHNEFPMCPTKTTIEDEWLSNYQKEMKLKFDIKGKSNKLCLTLFDKKEYIVHYRNLKYYLAKGLELQKINKVLKFNQSPWLKPYIELNTRLRQEANSKLEESFAKLMNNSFFGKTLQDKRKFTNIKIATSLKEAQNLIASPRIQRWKLIEEELGIFDEGKYSVKLDKPRYVGFCVLELSKLIMYQFHYDYILQQFPKTKIMFTDTDSFCYHIKTEKDVYEEIKGHSEWFDFSNYPKHHENFDQMINHLKPGVFKDEMGGKAINEFIGLRSKMYSIKDGEGKGKRTAKGIQQSSQRHISHEQYRSSLFNTESYSFTGKKIMQKEHSLYLAEIRKKGLCPYNDKKYIMRENDIFETKSFGHYSLRK